MLQRIENKSFLRIKYLLRKNTLALASQYAFSYLH